ncbi:DNA-binding transcriptional LysR family regulator [Nitrobacteraceae bacterium AZCC 1564]
MDRLAVMATFVKIVETGSLSAAARAIPTSLTSVSRQVAMLEDRLGTQLLRRTTRSLALTEDGRLFYDHAKTILGEWEDMEFALSSGRAEPTGRLHISAPVLMGKMMLAPMLPPFLARHPSVAIDLLLIDRTINLVEDNIHIAIRVGRLPDSQFVARKLGDVHMVLCAAPDYLSRRGTPQTPDELSHHDCLVFSEAPGAAEWSFQFASNRKTVPVSGRFSANNLETLVSAAISGVGIARVPSWQITGDIAAGRLQRILTTYERPPAPVHMIFQHTKLSSPKIRAFLDYLTTHWARSDDRVASDPKRPISKATE